MLPSNWETANENYFTCCLPPPPPPSKHTTISVWNDRRVNIRGGDCHQAFLPHRECVCYDRCPRCSVEFELDVNFDRVNQTRPEQERDLPLTVTSADLVRLLSSIVLKPCSAFLGMFTCLFGLGWRETSCLNDIAHVIHIIPRNPTTY